MPEKKFDQYCSACGSGLISSAIICPKCGSATSRFPSSSAVQGKQKVVAVVLAVFLGFWTYLYTYREDSVKFWLSISAWFGSWIILFWTAAIAAESNSLAFYTFLGLLLFIVLGINFATWLIALIIAARRDESYYANLSRRY